VGAQRAEGCGRLPGKEVRLRQAGEFRHGGVEVDRAPAPRGGDETQSRPAGQNLAAAANRELGISLRPSFDINWVRGGILCIGGG
jgi:hypothetical protein